MLRTEHKQPSGYPFVASSYQHGSDILLSTPDYAGILIPVATLVEILRLHSPEGFYDD